MTAWGKWFASIGDRTAENVGFHGGAREISSGGIRDLPMDMESITGYSIITARDLDEAVSVAQGNPFIAGIRVYGITGS